MRRGLWIMISRFYLYRARGDCDYNRRGCSACAGAVIIIAEAVPRARGLWIMISRFVAVLRQ